MTDFIPCEDPICDLSKDHVSPHRLKPEFKRDIPRKIIQISGINHPESDGGYWALCDDGTVWQRVYDGSTWSLEPGIPGSEVSR